MVWPVRLTFTGNVCSWYNHNIIATISLKKQNISLSGNLYAVNTSLSEEAQARIYASSSLTFGIDAEWKDKTQRQLLSFEKQAALIF